MDQREIEALERQLAELQQTVRGYQTSTSWRMTAPLRAMATTFKSWPRRNKVAPARLAAQPQPVPDSPSPPAVLEPTSFSDAQLASGAYWDSVVARAAEIPSRTAWWNDPVTLRHINRVVCGLPLDGAHAGFNIRLGQVLRERGMTGPRAISVGSGSGGKELTVLQAGLVGSFDCFEAGLGGVEAGRRMAAEHGVSDRLRFHHADAFSTDVATDYDLVYWNNALHHMPDTRAAIRWSRDRLRPGGVFAMDDYVGESRFQHTPDLIAWGNRMLALLPDRLLRHWEGTSRLIPRSVWVHDPAAIAAIDPTEAVDSGNILPGLRAVFDDAEIIPTGGALYFAALNDAFHNFVSDEDVRMLNALLLIDEAVAQQGETPYAVAFATRPA